MSILKLKRDSSGPKRYSQCEELMRKFAESHEEKCMTVSLDFPRIRRTMKRFPTGSCYEGTWDVLGMSGYGTYTFHNGVIYEGELDDGMFHGFGELRYPSGETIKGKWKKGALVERTLIFDDGLPYEEYDWSYCRAPDRRFTLECKTGLQPAGQSYLTADQAPRAIPPGLYDTGDGFYDPKTKVVFKADDITAIVRSPSIQEQKWIMENCRTNPMPHLGPRKELYEEWLAPSLKLPRPPEKLLDTPNHSPPHQYPDEYYIK
ncbi:MORN repeat-containing protein 5-like isoform X3 [Leptidea sinapis]|uniref:MORN repeat-containing protein 5-like isoform X3 n=1 Tax=Leptidea sinapis TaxID=189913 RepID=UPI0021C42447|nr:MORN repeat-containing protein 5-like isoform X3 [Leptidea sinapis]